MNRIRIVVRLGTGQELDLDIPTDITADQLLTALYEGLRLPGARPAYLRSENPLAMLSGQNRLSDYALRDGSVLYPERGRGEC